MKINNILIFTLIVAMLPTNLAFCAKNFKKKQSIFGNKNKVVKTRKKCPSVDYKKTFWPQKKNISLLNISFLIQCTNNAPYRDAPYIIELKKIDRKIKTNKPLERKLNFK